MTEIEKLLRKYHLAVQKDEELEIPHIMYERRGMNEEIIISKNFILEYKMLVQKEYISPENLEDSFYQFEKQFFSKYFFREDTDLKWNYYLIIIVDENAEENETICQLENDDKFLRKLVMTIDELEIYLGHGGTGTENSKRNITGMDTYGEWQKNLSSLNLEGILTCSYEGSKVQGYIDEDIGIKSQEGIGSNWDNTESRNSKYLVEKIESLYMEEFREHCLPKNKEISLSRVNLFSGSNGSGKSSLCAAIEYAMTGEIFDSVAEGSTFVKIRNREGKQEVLTSGIPSKEKRELDRLWYGTTTTGTTIHLNGHFHVFNYLGLEASREYISDLEINELVKNVLFGTEVTEAEKKMRRYGKEFADRKKAYDKQVREIAAEIKEKAEKDGTMEDIPKEEIMRYLRQLGYKKYREEDVELKEDAFLKKYLEIVADSHEDAERLLELCSEGEDAKCISRKKAEFLSKKEKHQLYRENERKVENLRRKQEDSKKLISEYTNRMSEIDNLYHQGEGMEGIFLNRWDFRDQDNEYKRKTVRKDELEQWLKKYQNIPDVEEDFTRLEKEIEEKRSEIEAVRRDIEKISNEIEIQKGLRNSLDIVMQEIYSLSERYIKVDPDATHCPMCGADYKERGVLAEVLKKHKKYEEADDESIQLLLNTRSEKEQMVNAEMKALQEVTQKKTMLQEKQSAVAKLKGLIDMDGLKKGEEIVKAVQDEVKKLQAWMDCHTKMWVYAKAVLCSDELTKYDGTLEWMSYLNKVIWELKEKIEKETKRIKEQEVQEQELLQQLAAEDSVFPEEEWKSCQVKASVYEELLLEWDIASDMPLQQWAKEFRNFRRKVEYAQELYKKRKEYVEGQMYMAKLQKDKELLDKKSRKCQEAYQLIDAQRKLEDIMMDFLQQNQRQIELFFKILHRPKEFGTLKICDGKISIVRNSNGKEVESSQMSTGQRMALAFSIMITLHKNAPNAPKFLMLDEPVANLDDMHVLNLIDLLRELALSGTQIIMTTADRQMAKYLRRKFSFFQKEYTHYELIRKGSKKTYMKENHYSHDKKAAISS